MKRSYVRYVAVAAAFLILIAGMLIFSSAMLKKGKQAEPVNKTDPADGGIHFTGEVEKMDGEVIASEIRDMGQLVTAEYFYSHAESYENMKTWLGHAWDVTKKSFVYTVDGNIKAGIDFRLINVTVDDEAKTIQIAIPKAEIISSEIDHDSFQLVNEKDGWFNDLSAEDVNKTFVHVKEMEEEKAFANGLLTRADENAAALLTSFVKSLDVKDYTVKIEEQNV